MPSVYEDVLNRARNGLARPGADRTYADADDHTWMDVDWPSLSRDIEIDGRLVHVVDTGGDKPPLLFLHGLGGVWQNWLLNIAAFKDTHRCVAFDLPGFGESEMPREDISIPGFAQAADAVCRELRIDNPVVLGNSMGGFVGRRARAAVPDACVEARARLRRRAVDRVRQARAGARHRAGVGGADDARWARSPTRSCARPRGRRAGAAGGRPVSREAVGAARHRARARRRLTGFNDAFRALLTYSFRDKLERIEIPVLIVWGRNDILVPVDDAEEFEHLIGENAHSVIFDDTGHLAMLERPSRFNELVRGFLAGERAPETGVEGVSA